MASAASPPPFTFASPVSFSSETHEDALDFDYESWIQQSKTANCYSNKRLWMDDAEAEVINRYHQEMMLRVADNLLEQAYELSLRDITELSLPPPPPPPPRATPTRSLPCRHKSTPSISMEGAGSFIIKLFMPSPSRAAAASSGSGRRNKSFFMPSPSRAAASSSSGAGRRNKSFSSSSTTVSVLRKKSAPANHCRSRSMENDTHSNGYHDSTKR